MIVSVQDSAEKLPLTLTLSSLSLAFTVSSGDGPVSSCWLCRLLAGGPVELSGGGSDGSGVHDLFLQF